jgi:hypothetical protein
MNTPKIRIQIRNFKLKEKREGWKQGRSWPSWNSSACHEEQTLEAGYVRLLLHGATAQGAIDQAVRLLVAVAVAGGQIELGPVVVGVKARAG